ncbi:MAG: cytidine deaminase [Bdellovibrionales bacterium]|nr:cytidine deaminase [Bdellovibrionales bacterium]
MTKEQKQELISEAAKALAFSYSPYSHYQVGCAVLLADGEIVSGCNVENASFGATVCAERVAIWKAVSEGHKKFVAAAVATKKGWYPCGMCLQVMAEFMNDVPVLIVDQDQNVTETSFKSLFPNSFSPKNF